jgi:hypothetical protein
LDSILYKEDPVDDGQHSPPPPNIIIAIVVRDEGGCGGGGEKPLATSGETGLLIIVVVVVEEQPLSLFAPFIGFPPPPPPLGLGAEPPAAEPEAASRSFTRTALSGCCDWMWPT